MTIRRFNQPFPLNDPHRFNLKDKLEEDHYLLSLGILPRLRPQAPTGCQSLITIVILLAARTRELPRSSYAFLPNRLSAQINLLSSRPPTIPSPSFNGPNGYNNGGGPPKDYFSVDPRHSQQSHLSSTLRPGSSRSTASPTVPHSSLYPKDDADPIYGWKEPTSLSRADSGRPPLPPKIPSQLTQITRMPEPSIPTENMYSSYPDSRGSSGPSLSIYRNDSSGSYVLPPLPHKAYPPGKLVNPHTDSPSCKTHFSLPESII